MKRAEDVSKEVCTFENKDYSSRDRKIDKILTSKKFGIPIMILFLGIIFWLTIVGAITHLKHCLVYLIGYKTN